jgi:hypothetical protein
VFNKPNPLMQLFFLALIIGGFAVYVHFGLPLIPNSRLGFIHIPMSFIAVLWLLFTFVLASMAPPGFVTAANAEALEKAYPYDGFLFVRHKCPTCGTPKVARSKHCRMLGRCVEKYDHFCPWINNCVGGLNYKYFLLFVASTAMFLIYGTFVLVNVLLYIIERDNLWNVKFMHTGSNQVMDADWRIVGQYMIAQHGMLLFILVLCSVMALTLVGFTVYQLYLISQGRTANENSKWQDVFDLYYSRKWQEEMQLRAKGEVQSPPDAQLLRADATPLNERLLKDFPAHIPPNVYNKGFWANLKQVLFPVSSEARKQIAQAKRNGVQADSATAKKEPQSDATAPSAKQQEIKTEKPESKNKKKNKKTN